MKDVILGTVVLTVGIIVGSVLGLNFIGNALEFTRPLPAEYEMPGQGLTVIQADPKQMHVETHNPQDSTSPQVTREF